MDYLTFLDAVIRKGIAAAARDYAGKPIKLAGAVAGFEACRNKTPEELRALLADARATVEAARGKHLPEFWTLACKAAEIEWTCNCVSFLLARAGAPTIVAPTARAAITAASILGVASPD